MSEDLELRRKRALWRAAHRGTKELDILIGGYADVHLAKMAEAELETFEALLNVSEPVLQGWLLAPELPSDVEGDFRHLVGSIRKYHGLLDGK